MIRDIDDLLAYRHVNTQPEPILSYRHLFRPVAYVRETPTEQLGSLPADLLLVLGREVETPPHFQLPPDGLGRVVLVHGLPPFQPDPLMWSSR